MQYYYGEQNLLRALDEAEFWKHQEAEHAGLIPVVTPNLEPQYVQKLEWFGAELSQTNAEAAKYIESITRSKGSVNRDMKAQILALIKKSVAQSQSFTDLMADMLQKSQAVRASKPSQTVIPHMIRESQYFVGIDQLILGK